MPPSIAAVPLALATLGTLTSGGTLASVGLFFLKTGARVFGSGLAIVPLLGDGVVAHRLNLPGCDHDHELALDTADQLAFVACDGNARLLTVDLKTWQVTGDNPVGVDPDVLAFDSGAGRLYVACESGWLTIADRHGRTLTIAGSAHFADGSHVVALDPTTHRSYYLIPSGPDGKPTLLIDQPTP